MYDNKKILLIIMIIIVIYRKYGVRGLSPKFRENQFRSLTESTSESIQKGDIG